MDSVEFGGFVSLRPADAPEEGSFWGRVHQGRTPSRAYGGSLLANGIAAAYQGLDPARQVNSLHAYFLRPVHSERPVLFTPESVREGRNYSVRRVDASQDGKLRFTMTASFKTASAGGFARQAEMPDVTGPEGLPDGFADREAESAFRTTLEFGELPAERGRAEGEITRYGWFRVRRPLPDEGARRAALAYLCDATLTPTALLRHRRGELPRFFIASLDHAMWFHRDAAIRTGGEGDWLLYAQRSRYEGDGRTWAQGDLWTRDGLLLASVAQEAVLEFEQA